MQNDEKNCEKIKKSQKSDSCQLKISGKNRPIAAQLSAIYQRLYPEATASDSSLSNMVNISLRHTLKSIEEALGTLHTSQSDKEQQAEILRSIMRP